MRPRSVADRLIQNHVLYAIAAGVIPVPLLDIAAVVAVQVDLVRALARVYEVRFDETSGKALITCLVGASAARIGASALKAAPGFGLVPGVVLEAGLAAVSTYAVGHLFRAQFEDRATRRKFESQVLRSKYEALLEKSRAFARGVRDRRHSVEARTDLFARLARRRANPITTETECGRLRSEVLPVPPEARS
jgi:uncharacterized protein (DUF697 family)